MNDDFRRDDWQELLGQEDNTDLTESVEQELDRLLWEMGAADDLDIGEPDSEEVEDGLRQVFEEMPEEPEEPEEMQSRPVRRSRPHRKAIKKKGAGLLGIPHFLTTLVLCAMVVALGVTAARVLWLMADDVLALTKQDKEIVITVSDTDTMHDITQKLTDAGLVRYPKLFDFYSKLTSAREKISSGTFTLNSMFDYHALVNALGSSYFREVTTVMVPEGYEAQQIFALLEEEGVCPAAELEEASQECDFSDYWFLEGVSQDGPYCLEGFLFPDTYEFYLGDDAERVLRKFLNDFEGRFDDDLREEAVQLNQLLSDRLAEYGYSEETIAQKQLSVRDIVTVASMIERETANSGESTLIASVIYNRLCDPEYLYLNIDATIQYALGEHKESLSLEDTQIDSPYNTYLNPGLPIGPIANPGLSSLKAALRPADSDYYFYALNTDGTHHFSETYSEHQQFLDSLEAGDE